MKVPKRSEHRLPLEFQKWLGNWSEQHARAIIIFEISMPRALGICDGFFWGSPFHKIRHGRRVQIEVQVHFSNYYKEQLQKPFKSQLKTILC